MVDVPVTSYLGNKFPALLLGLKGIFFPLIYFFGLKGRPPPHDENNFLIFNGHVYGQNETKCQSWN